VLLANQLTPRELASAAWGWANRHRAWLVLGLILVVTVAAHAVNMFDFPYYEDDEGTYVSQAWAVLTQGHLAPYTYWYDHAPVGWIQIAAWGLITGGLHTFGSAVESGRVLMLGFQIGSTVLLFWIARRLSHWVFRCSRKSSRSLSSPRWPPWCGSEPRAPCVRLL
jgi:hypothetical protein